MFHQPDASSVHPAASQNEVSAGAVELERLLMYAEIIEGLRSCTMKLWVKVGASSFVWVSSILRSRFILD